MRRRIKDEQGNYLWFDNDDEYNSYKRSSCLGKIVSKIIKAGVVFFIIYIVYFAGSGNNDQSQTQTEKKVKNITEIQNDTIDSFISVVENTEQAEEEITIVDDSVKQIEHEEIPADQEAIEEIAEPEKKEDIQNEPELSTESN